MEGTTESIVTQKMGTAGSSGMLVITYKTVQFYNSEDQSSGICHEKSRSLKYFRVLLYPLHGAYKLKKRGYCHRNKCFY
jgi:hypothetical protein